MDRTLILDCKKLVSESVKVEGFVQTRRDHGKIAFLDVTDRTGLLQVFCSGEQIKGITLQDVVSITGVISNRPENLVNKNIPTGEIELKAEVIKVLSKSAELPFDMGTRDLDLQLPTLLDFRALTLRHPRIKSIFKIQEKLYEGFRNSAKELGCTEIFVPTISASSTEGGAEVFSVKYFNHQAFLVQSPQLYKQIMVPVFERIYLASHAYRSEPSMTTRHLTEAIQLDIEVGFMEFEQLMDCFEHVAKQMLEFASNKVGELIKEFNVELPKVSSKIPRLTLKEAQEIIFKKTGRDVRNEKDLSPEDERDISNWALLEHQSDLVTITHFPAGKRAFYTMPDPINPQFSLSYDLLFKGVEILSGSQRIHSYDKLVEAIKERGMDPQDFLMYLQAFKFGMPPHGGFSFGLERITMLLLGLANVREASLFPRDMERIDFRLTDPGLIGIDPNESQD